MVLVEIFVQFDQLPGANPSLLTESFELALSTIDIPFDKGRLLKRAMTLGYVWGARVQGLRGV